jgi:hypothetical protein
LLEYQRQQAIDIQEGHLPRREVALLHASLDPRSAGRGSRFEFAAGIVFARRLNDDRARASVRHFRANTGAWSLKNMAGLILALLHHSVMLKHSAVP